MVEAAYADAPHLVERLGLFVIIVPGEGVIQITSVAGASWRRTLRWALPCLGLTLLPAGWSGHFGVGWLSWGLTAAVAWQLLCASGVPAPPARRRGV